MTKPHEITAPSQRAFLGCLMAAGLLGAALASSARAADSPQVQVVARQEDAYNAKDLEGFIATYSPSAVVMDLASGKELAVGREAMRARYAVRFDQSPDLHATILKRLAAGSVVVDRESLLWKKSEPSIESIVVYLLQNGQIVRVWFVSFDKQSALPGPASTDTVQQLAAAINQHGVNRTIELFDPRFEMRTLAVGAVAVRNVSDLRRIFVEKFDGSPTYSIAVVNTIVAGPFVVAQERVSGDTQRGNFDRITIFEVIGGKVRRMWQTSE